MFHFPAKQIGVAIIVNEDKQILIDKRLPKGSMANLWEFPGGKIEEGETIDECIKREVREELGIEIAVNEHLVDINHTYNDFSILLKAYLAKIVEGTPKTIECAEIRWVNIDKLTSFPFPSANQGIIEAITKRFSS